MPSPKSGEASIEVFLGWRVGMCVQDCGGLEVLSTYQHQESGPLSLNLMKTHDVFQTIMIFSLISCRDEPYTGCAWYVVNGSLGPVNSQWSRNEVNITDAYTSKKTAVPVVLFLHSLGAAMAMHGWCHRVKSVDEIKMIIRSQCLLVLDDDELMRVYGISQPEEIILSKIIQVNALNCRAKLGSISNPNHPTVGSVHAFTLELGPGLMGVIFNSGIVACGIVVIFSMFSLQRSRGLISVNYKQLLTIGNFGYLVE